MDPEQIRRQSLTTLRAHGLSVPETLPLLDEAKLRSEADVLRRLLCLHAVAAASYGFDRSKALRWIDREMLSDIITSSERAFVEKATGNPVAYQVQVEAMWALAWSLGLVPELDFWKNCDSNFAALLPNLKLDESGKALSERVAMRPLNEIQEACDLSYSLHWLVREGLLANKIPEGLTPYVIEERRRALEWLTAEDSWEEVNLDT